MKQNPTSKAQKQSPATIHFSFKAQFKLPSPSFPLLLFPVRALLFNDQPLQPFTQTRNANHLLMQFAFWPLHANISHLFSHYPIAICFHVQLSISSSTSHYSISLQQFLQAIFSNCFTCSSLTFYLHLMHDQQHVFHPPLKHVRQLAVSFQAVLISSRFGPLNAHSSFSYVRYLPCMCNAQHPSSRVSNLQVVLIPR